MSWKSETYNQLKRDILWTGIIINPTNTKYLLIDGSDHDGTSLRTNRQLVLFYERVQQIFPNRNFGRIPKYIGCLEDRVSH